MIADQPYIAPETLTKLEGDARGGAALSIREMSGAPVFQGTRVLAQTLIEYLEAGDSIDDFLEGFPSVTREQVIAFLEETKARVLAFGE